jgi:CBS domain containing-hemolysin-like protein
MTNLILAVLFIGLALLGTVLRKTYYQIPLHELKRRAEKRDLTAEKLYRAAAYGDSLRGLLWLFIALTSAIGFVLLARELSAIWLSVTIIVVLLWIAFSWLPASKLSKLSIKITSIFTPLITRLLNYLHPILSRSVGVAQKRYSAPAHTGIFERDDLIELIEKQQVQADSRLTDEELEIVKSALTFNEHTVSEIIIPRKQIKTVLATDTVGPVLIDELHKTGQPFVLVKDKRGGMVIGSLELAELGIHSTGTVADHMDAKVYYLHEQDSLSEALHAFYVTNHPMFIVVNNFEEYLGIVTVESILNQLLGHIPGDDFDLYGDVKAIAERHNKPEPTETDDETPVEVVE